MGAPLGVLALACLLCMGLCDGSGESIPVKAAGRGGRGGWQGVTSTHEIDPCCRAMTIAFLAGLKFLLTLIRTHVRARARAREKRIVVVPF